eukprot:CAMPEP_0203683550 /NCGR_PEP_ID=MMETSP0090-20130426/47577_1 /ASSEMBLY_ACC=CAM_ASM_001088 /TAXON_ID=426623 /ORGANISM="Chaetoceros affinis, Strain CCMP159" /LENGTH=669 /DNA_ID=CAMNT_0050552699 /DNA_START=382 /DNA_END=2392 /DNA_ORIENTATION=+
MTSNTSNTTKSYRGKQSSGSGKFFYRKKDDGNNDDDNNSKYISNTIKSTPTSTSTSTSTSTPLATMTSNTSNTTKSYRGKQSSGSGKSATSTNTSTKRVHKKKDGNDAPVFLKKTYHMIDSCEPSIGSWSDDGDSFLVKDPDKFAKEIIPQFFKHNNFSSFVRQLNFYGFKKIKNDPIRLIEGADPPESKWWRFRHDNFKKGRIDLLVEIKKSNQQNAADQEEVNALKDEVTSLKEELSSMKGEMEKVTALMEKMMMTNTTNATNAAAQQQQQQQQQQMQNNALTTSSQNQNYSVEFYEGGDGEGYSLDGENDDANTTNATNSTNTAAQQQQMQNNALTTSSQNQNYSNYNQQQQLYHNDQQMEDIQYIPTQPQQKPLSGQKRIKMTPEYQINPPPQTPSQLALPVLDNMYNLPDIPLQIPDRPPLSGVERAYSQTSIASFDPTDLDDILGVPSDSGMGIDMDTSISTATNLLPAIDGSMNSMNSMNNTSGSQNDPLHAGMNALALAPVSAASTLNNTNPHGTSTATSATSAATVTSHETILDMNPNLRQQFQYALSCLPIDMQRLFVERLISMVSNPETMQNHIEAVNALASAAARVEDGVEKKDVPLQLAVATLGSFLTQYAKAKNTRSGSSDGTSSRLSGAEGVFFSTVGELRLKLRVEVEVEIEA